MSIAHSPTPNNSQRQKRVHLSQDGSFEIYTREDMMGCSNGTDATMHMKHESSYIFAP